MPSNKDLISAIEAEAVEQNLTGDDAPVTKGKNNNELVAILADLKTPPVPPAPDSTDDADSTDDVVEVKPPYYIADGKSLVCKKGVLDSGAEMKAEYSAGGQESLNALVKKGVVIKS